MSVNQYRSQLNNKRKQRVEAEKKAGEFRTKESKKRAEAAAARAAASKTTTASTAKSKLGEATRKDKDAATAGKDAGRWQSKASTYAREESAIQLKLSRAEKTAADTIERDRKRQEQQTRRLSAGLEAALMSKPSQTLRELRAPKPEKLRLLILGASSEGDIRVGREQKRIRAAVESALHRDRIEFDVRPAATAADLLDGISRFRPHVVHFSGHSDEGFLEFEKDLDERHTGIDVRAGAFARAIQATDTPPLLVLLNSCNSASQIDDLVAKVVPFAIGMADAIEDADAINYAAQFYAAVANGQSINAAHLSGQAALELAGLNGADLPTLASAPDVDPRLTILVEATRQTSFD
ncbi:hypothetical protein [Nocardia camponoti]|uniref:CHAT domain-containing protein n=1 Tax=Nocardia camponoti TaxID=1616106 RepID=A0A917QB02_9NOCA|nr:hypothetical protein [Nocardia camponoti]GGK40316.1 CHAT domain-containing protein [Nocardia camponoti]